MKTSEPRPPTAGSGSRVVRYLRRLGAGSLVLSIAIHTLFIGGATAYVVTVVNPPPRANFNPGSGGGQNSGPPAEVRRAVQAARTTVAPVPVAATTRLAVEGVSAVSLPELPALGAVSSLPAASTGGGGSLGSTLVPGNPGLGTGPALRMMPFGLAEFSAPAFEGVIYDTKRPAKGKKLPPDSNNYRAIVERFVKGGWRAGDIDEFFSAPRKLYNTEFNIPTMKAVEAPKAFGVENEVKPERWFALYRARISPPQDGKYRLWGMADDLIAVRWEGKTGFVSITEQPRNPFPVFGTRIFNNGPFIMMATDWMDLKADRVYEVQVLLGEHPGGSFWARLLYEREGMPEHPLDRFKKPSPPVLRIAKTDTTPPDAEIWKAHPLPKR